MAATSPTAIRMRDEVFDVGNDRELVSILTRPDGGAGDRPAVIFLNAGVLHRVGPHRLHVTLARRLAARGLPALRSIPRPTPAARRSCASWARGSG